MAGNSSRKGAVRKSKKGATKGSGGERRQGLEGKGPTPKASDRPGHPAARKQARRRGGAPRGARNEERREVILGRNAVDEALAAGIPAVELAVGEFLNDDARTTRAKAAAQRAGIPMTVRTKIEMDRLGDGLPHQGIVLLIAPFRYVELHDVIANAPADSGRQIVVVLDHIQDGRNLGAIARSAAAFAASGLVLPNRRAASVSASAWRASAGALSRLPVAQIANMAGSIKSLKKAGFLTIGLAAGGGIPLTEIDRDVLDRPVALVVGSEATGMSRLVAESCDLLTTIPITTSTESLNASVATAIALHHLRLA